MYKKILTLIVAFIVALTPIFCCYADTVESVQDAQTKHDALIEKAFRDGVSSDELLLSKFGNLYDIDSALVGYDTIKSYITQYKNVAYVIENVSTPVRTDNQYGAGVNEEGYHDYFVFSNDESLNLNDVANYPGYFEASCDGYIDVTNTWMKWDLTALTVDQIQEIFDNKMFQGCFSVDHVNFYKIDNYQFGQSYTHKTHIYSVKGNVTHNNNSVDDVQSKIDDYRQQSDKLYNFNFNGTGVAICAPVENAYVTGYSDNGVLSDKGKKYMDVILCGQIDCREDTSLPTPLIDYGLFFFKNLPKGDAKKDFMTSAVCALDGNTYNSSNGLIVKNFEWVNNKPYCINFRMTLKIPLCVKKNNVSVYAGCNLTNSKFYDDSVKINTLSSNDKEDYGVYIDPEKYKTDNNLTDNDVIGNGCSKDNKVNVDENGDSNYDYDIDSSSKVSGSYNDSNTCITDSSEKESNNNNNNYYYNVTNNTYYDYSSTIVETPTTETPTTEIPTTETPKNDVSSGDTGTGFHGIEAILNFITKIINMILDFFASIIEILSHVISISQGMKDTFNGLFSFLPDPIPQLISTAIVCYIVIAFIKFLRG